MRWLLPFALGFALAGSVMAIQKAYSGYDHPFISLMERHFQVFPGQTKVWPDCGCTVRYVGTTVHGRRYTVIIDKLD
jgi:hypothetical protein